MIYAELLLVLGDGSLLVLMYMCSDCNNESRRADVYNRQYCYLIELYITVRKSSKYMMVIISHIKKMLK